MPFSKQVEDIIADFRSLPRTVTESSRYVPVRLDSVLDVLKEKYNLEKPSAELSIVSHWSELFGNLSGRCRPLSIKGGNTLIISVANQTLRAELQFRKHTILKKIQQLPYCGIIGELVIRA